MHVILEKLRRKKYRYCKLIIVFDKLQCYVVRLNDEDNSVRNLVLELVACVRYGRSPFANTRYLGGALQELWWNGCVQN